MPRYHLAQINVARMLAPIDDPLMLGFVSQLPAINELADRSQGYVWRLQSDSGDATSIKVYDDDMIIVNLTVWESTDALKEFVYKSGHSGVMRDHKRWFEKFDGLYYAMWWIPSGHISNTHEAKERLEHLRTHGDSHFAFSFKNLFPEPEQ
jgi:hypothetical protein